jgi:hypothetical protein
MDLPPATVARDETFAACTELLDLLDERPHTRTSSSSTLPSLSRTRPNTSTLTKCRLRSECPSVNCSRTELSEHVCRDGDRKSFATGEVLNRREFWITSTVAACGVWYEYRRRQRHQRVEPPPELQSTTHELWLGHAVRLARPHGGVSIPAHFRL